MSLASGSGAGTGAGTVAARGARGTRRPADGPLAASLRVIWAVMLRDVRTRFFNHGLGYLVAIVWPLVHVLILIGFYVFFGRAVPYGDSAYVFFAVGLTPFMAWNYMSRFVMLSLLMNRPLLAFPAVKVLDVLFGRAALEVLCVFCFIIFLCALGLVMGYDVAPHDLVQASLALAVTIGLGLGFGMVSAVISMMAPGWVTVHMLMIIVFYIASGVIFLPPEMPAQVLEALAWLPLIHATEWMRGAFFEGYPVTILDRGYVTAWAVGSILLGLTLERALRGRMLIG